MTDVKNEDQAKQLREKMDSYQLGKDGEQSIETLPPRSRVHKKRTQPKKKFKLTFPLIRLLLVLFLALIIAALTYPYWN